MTDVRNVSDHSKGTDRESEGAFTPTKSPCNRMFRSRPKAGDVGALNPGNRFRITGNSLKEEAVGRNERSQRSCQRA